MKLRKIVILILFFNELGAKFEKKKKISNEPNVDFELRCISLPVGIVCTIFTNEEESRKDLGLQRFIDNALMHLDEETSTEV